jgi:hypothetical protein
MVSALLDGRALTASGCAKTEIEQDDKVYLLRNPAPGCPLSRTLGVALPPLVCNATATSRAAFAQATKTPPKTPAP